MAGEQDLAGILAELEKDKENIEIAISVIKKKMGLPTNGLSATGVPGQLRSDAFFRKGIAEAAAMFLRMGRDPKTSAEIAEALERGGIATQAKDLKATVHAVLVRDAAKWGITRLTSGAWGLDEWYGSGSGSSSGKKQVKRPQKEQASGEPVGEPAKTEEASG
jgi:hypothetical protein